MAFCNNCGSEMDGGARFCLRCGAAVAPAALPTTPASGTPFPPAGGATHRLSFHGSGGDLLLLYVKIVLLSIITLGIYSFWGRTQLRQYFAENSRFDNVAFAYHGTGLELLIGWLKALAFFALLFCQMFVLTLLLGQKLGTIAGAVVFYAALLCVIPFALVGAWRYRMSRTSLRGIRFSFRGNAVEFLKIYIPGALLTIITLAVYAPVFLNNIRKYYCKNAYFGNAKFDYDGDGKELLMPWVVCLLLLPFTLGISMLWFNVHRFNFQWNHSSFMNARFVANVSFADYFLLVFTNALLTIFTLGIATPWAMIRVFRFDLDRLTLQGDVNMQTIAQDFINASPVGEGVATFLDTGATDIGLGL